MELNICHLYPDVLNLYGDRGNIACMKKRLEWRGIGCAVTELPLGTADDLTGYDLFFIGGGQDFEQTVLLADLRAGRAENIRAAAEDGKTLLCICGGYQLLGNGYRTAAGQWCDYTGILDFTTEGSYERLIGNYAYRLGEESGGGIVIGFENHGGRTRLGASLTPLGTVLRGHGNNGEDGTEGVRYKNVYGTYSHGPLLPKNPALCDEILRGALVAALEKAGVELNNAAVSNIAPRLRMTALYAVAAAEHRLVAGTGNRSEAFMGYCTKWGDAAADFNPIADLSVTEVFEFLDYLDAPETIRHKAPSAGLFEGQTDEKEMGVSYAAIDRYMDGGAVTDAERAIIERFHRNSEHKRVGRKDYRAN